MRKKTRRRSTVLRMNQTLGIITRYLKKHGYSPTVREIMLLGEFSSTSMVVRYLDLLEEDGWILRDPYRSRTIRVLVRKSR